MDWILSVLFLSHSLLVFEIRFTDSFKQYLSKLVNWRASVSLFLSTSYEIRWTKLRLVYIRTDMRTQLYSVHWQWFPPLPTHFANRCPSASKWWLCSVEWKNAWHKHIRTRVYIYIFDRKLNVFEKLEPKKERERDILRERENQNCSKKIQQDTNWTERENRRIA